MDELVCGRWEAPAELRYGAAQRLRLRVVGVGSAWCVIGFDLCESAIVLYVVRDEQLAVRRAQPGITEGNQHLTEVGEAVGYGVFDDRGQAIGSGHPPHPSEPTGLRRRLKEHLVDLLCPRAHLRRHFGKTAGLADLPYVHQ